MCVSDIHVFLSSELAKKRLLSGRLPVLVIFKFFLVVVVSGGAVLVMVVVIDNSSLSTVMEMLRAIVIFTWNIMELSVCMSVHHSVDFY